MPTNRHRRVRTSRRVPLNLTPEIVNRLKLKDFLGELTPEEIPLAKAAGVYKHDAHRKASARLQEGNNASDH